MTYIRGDKGSRLELALEGSNFTLVLVSPRGRQERFECSALEMGALYLEVGLALRAREKAETETPQAPAES